MVALRELADQVESFDGELRDGEDTIGAVLRMNNIGGDKARICRRGLNVVLMDRKFSRMSEARQERIDAIHDAQCGWLDR